MARGEKFFPSVFESGWDGGGGGGDERTSKEEVY